VAVNAAETGSFSSVLVAWVFFEVSREYKTSFLGTAAIWNRIKTVSLGFYWPPFLCLLVADCEHVYCERNQEYLDWEVGRGHGKLYVFRV